MSISLTAAEVRRFLLTHQGLLPPRALSGKEGVLRYLARVGCVQFDPLDQVGYNPNLVLQSRVKGYRPELLNRLLYRDRLLVDGFDKQLSIYPVADWPSFARYRDEAAARWGQGDSLFLQTEETVLREIEARGPLCSADFEATHKVNWPWGPTSAARAALESLCFQGRLVIHHKSGTRKYYDLAERHIAREILRAPDPHPADGQYLAWHVLRRIGSVGLLWNRAGDCWLGIRGMKSADRVAAFETLEAEGLLQPVAVEGIEAPCYIRAADRGALEQTLATGEAAPRMAFLAPLDNLIWDRKLISALFGFEYRWEVYTPQAQRKYGYYVLPVLYGDRFIARFEPKYHKREKTLELLNWWWEEGVRPNAAIRRAFRACLADFMKYLGAAAVRPGENCGWMGL